MVKNKWSMPILSALLIALIIFLILLILGDSALRGILTVSLAIFILFAFYSILGLVQLTESISNLDKKVSAMNEKLDNLSNAVNKN